MSAQPRLRDGNHDLLLIHCEGQRFEALDVGGMIERNYRRQQPKPSFIGIEEFGYGLAVVQELSRKGLPIHRLRADTDKISRALVAVARYEEHRISHPRGADWLDKWETELLAFPNAAHDDQEELHRLQHLQGAVRQTAVQVVDEDHDDAPVGPDEGR